MKKVRKLTNLLFSIGYFIFFIPLLVSVLSFSFNNSDFNNSYQVPSVQYEYETNEVSSEDDLVNGNIYHFEIEGATSDNKLVLYDLPSYTLELYFIKGNLNIYPNDYYAIDDFVNSICINNSMIQMIFDYDSIYIYLGDYIIDGYDYLSLYFEGCELYNVDFYFIYSSSSNLVSDNLLSYISASDYLGNATLTYNDSSLVDIALSNYTSSESISNANMANFLDSVGEVTIFSWCTDVSSYLFGGVSSFAYYWVLWTLVYLELFLFMQFFIWLFELIQLLGNKFLQKGE